MDSDGAGSLLHSAAHPAHQDLLAATAVGIVAVDSQGTIVSVNSAASSMLGWFEPELVGRPLQDVVKSDASDEARAFGNAVRRLMHVDDDAFRRRDGSLLPVWWATTPLRDTDSGAVLGAVLTFGDTTVQRARAAAEAAEAEQGRARLAAALANVATLEWVAELARVLSSTLDETEVLDRLTRLAVGQLADVVVADQIGEDGLLHRVRYAAAGWLRLDLDELLGDSATQPAFGPGSASYDLLSPSGVVHIPQDRLADPTLVSSESSALFAAVGATDVLVVPLVARSTVIGALALIRCGASRPYTDLDSAIARDVANRSALALDNARLYRAQHDIAGRLQQALLPRLPTGLPVRAAVRYLPAQNRFDVGGDWYDVFRCPDGDSSTTVLVVGDVAGHDLDAGTTMSALRNLLRGIAVATQTSPADVLGAVDNNLDALGITGTATIVVMTAVPDPSDGWRLTWSNAGHMPPLVLLPDGSIELLDEVHGPLVGTHLKVERTLSERTVPAGSTVVLYSDGLVEVRGETIDVGLTRLRRTALALHSPIDDPDAVADELLSMNQVSAEDDTAMLVCHLPAPSRDHS